MKWQKDQMKVMSSNKMVQDQWKQEECCTLYAHIYNADCVRILPIMTAVM